MADPDAGHAPAGGLRERKKAKTRAVIQQHALRLFHEQGYEQTTVEQIAEAAEVSPSTFFRYFPAKEDVVLYDAMDPFLVRSFREQPRELSPIQALRAAFRAVFDALSPEEIARQRERAELIFRVPDLRMKMLDEALDTIGVFGGILAERMGRPADDPAVRAMVGAMIGVVLAMALPAFQSGQADLFALIDQGFALLEKGLPG